MPKKANRPKGTPIKGIVEMTKTITSWIMVVTILSGAVIMAMTSPIRLKSILDFIFTAQVFALPGVLGGQVL